MFPGAFVGLFKEMRCNVLAEAIKEIKSLAQQLEQAQYPKVQKAESEPDGYYRLVSSGKVELVKAQPDWHCEVLDTPEAMVAFAEAAKGERSVLFCDDDGVVFVYDQADRRDTASLKLTETEQFAFLTKEPPRLTHKDAYRTLRVLFDGCLTEKSMLDWLKTTKFEVNKGIVSTVQQGRDSLGRTVDAACSGNGASNPEELTLVVPVYNELPTFKCVIRCFFDILAEEAMFRILPYAGQVRAARDLTLKQIMSLMAPVEIPVYQGKP